MATSPIRIQFAGNVIRPGSGDKARVVAIQQRLNQVGCGPVAEDGAFGPETFDAIELFQSRFVDAFGHPLKVDGQVGPMTWASLFGNATLPTVTATPSRLLTAVLTTATAEAEAHVMEVPPGSNRGPKVDEYLRTVGLVPQDGSFPWCAAFVYWCFEKAARQLAVPNPAIRTAGVLDLWNRAGASGVTRIGQQEADDSPAIVQPGMIFVLTTGSGNGHTGLVKKIEGIRLITIEGNTNDGGSREGVGVFERQGRTISGINRGFISYA
jgi:hypothetical protein